MKSANTFLLFIVIFFYVQNSYGQFDSKKYFHYTNLAELQIVDADYNTALKLYDSAFKFLQVPFSQDVYNYSICTALEKKYGKTYDAIRFLIARGCDSTIFTTNDVFKDFFKSKKTTFIKHYPAFISDRKKYVDSSIIKDIEEMNIADQYYYRNRMANISNKKFMDSLERNDSILITKMKDYFSKYNYLNESVIGVNTSASTPNCYPIFNIIIRHHYQDKHYELTPLLKTFVETGCLKPEVYASWVQLESSLIKSQYGEEGHITEMNDSLYIASYPGLKTKIEKNRSDIGLCTLDEQMRKTIFSRYTDKNKFLFFAEIGSISGYNDSYINSIRRFGYMIPIPKN